MMGNFHPYHIRKNFLSIFVILLVLPITLLIITLKPSQLSAQENTEPLIVWIVIDTLRADHLGSYGYPRNTSPSIDQVAYNGIRFTDAIAPSSWTLSSFASYLTGVYPLTHKMLTPYNYYSSSSEMLAEILKRNGFKTATFQRSIFVTDSYGLLRGFDTKIQLIPDDSILSSLAINWLNRRQNISGKTFLFLGYFSPHLPYNPPNSFLIKFINDGLIPEVTGITCQDLVADHNLWDPASFYTTEKYPWLESVFPECNFADPPGNFDPNLWVSAYDAEISYVDLQISKIINQLKILGVWSRTLLLITADHGEMMTEKRFSTQSTLGVRLPFSHGKTLDEGVIHVPLIIYSSLFESGLVIEKPVNTLDLVPTVLEYAGIEIPEHIQGKSLLPLITGQIPETKDFVFSYKIMLNKLGMPNNEFASVRGPLFKLVQTGNFIQNDIDLYLYNLDQDPEEKIDLSNGPNYSMLMNNMKYFLDQWIESQR